jgi:hypothetical protein
VNTVLINKALVIGHAKTFTGNPLSEELCKLNIAPALKELTTVD